MPHRARLRVRVRKRRIGRTSSAAARRRRRGPEVRRKAGDSPLSRVHLGLSPRKGHRQKAALLLQGRRHPTGAADSIAPGTLVVGGTAIPYRDVRGGTTPSSGGGLWLGSDAVDDGSWGYFVGHNPGSFAPVRSLSSGDARFFAALREHRLHLESQRSQIHLSHGKHPAPAIWSALLPITRRSRTATRLSAARARCASARCRVSAG